VVARAGPIAATAITRNVASARGRALALRDARRTRRSACVGPR